MPAKDLVIQNNILNGLTKRVASEQKFGQVIFDSLKKDPEHVGQIDAETGKQTTYKEMLDNSIRLALWMKNQGVKTNDIVVVCTHNHLDSYIPLFATFFVDAIFCGWNPDTKLYTAQRFTNLLSPKLIFTNENAADVLLEAVTSENSNAQLVVFGKHSKLSSLRDIITAQTQDEVNKFKLVNEKSPQDVAAIIFSSGSSGFPKGIMLSNKLQLPPDAYTIPSNTKIRYLWYSTLDWITALHFTFKAITEKGTRIIAAPNDVKGFFQTIQKYKINYILMPPPIINDLAKSGLAKKYDLKNLKMILTTGTKVSKEVLLSFQREFPKAFVGQGYGMTEVGGFLSYARLRSKHIDSVGIVAPNCKVKIVDTTTGETLGPNKNGELYAKTPSMMIGYYKNPEATKEAVDAEGWYHSGDLAYYDESGEIFIVQRIKELITFRYDRIAPGEIEEILVSHPNVQEAIVVPIPVGIDGHRPVAFIKTVPGSNVTKNELMKLTSVLEHYKELQGIYFVDDLPRLPSGKIDRNKLKERAENLAKGRQQ